jgi:hypothetical protein
VISYTERHRQFTITWETYWIQHFAHLTAIVSWMICHSELIIRQWTTTLLTGFNATDWRRFIKLLITRATLGLIITFNVLTLTLQHTTNADACAVGYNCFVLALLL